MLRRWYLSVSVEEKFLRHKFNYNTLKVERMTSTIPLLCVCLTFTGFIAAASGRSSFDEELKLNHLERDLKSWVPPQEFRTNFTYFLSGYDDEEIPMWITEWGQWDIRKFVEEGGEVVENLEKFIDKIIWDVFHSIHFRNASVDTTPGIKAIIDLEGFSYSQLASLPTVRFYLKKFTYLAPLLEKYLNKAYVINANFVAEEGINMLRPVLAGAIEKMEIYGSNKSKWMPRIRKDVPKEILPEWYGGSKDFKPLKVYG